MSTIPASQLVNVIPGVIGAGGNPLSLNAVFLTQNPAVPIGAVMAFATLADVQDFFGPLATESVLAGVYFAGFTGATTLPGTLYFAQYNTADVAAYLRSGSLEGMTLAQLQALSGTLLPVIDGRTITTGNINLAGATSFTNAAAVLQTGVRAAGGLFSGTGTIDDGAGGAGTVLTITVVTSGTLQVGDKLTGGTITANTTVLAQVSGDQGGVGVYTVDIAQDYNPGGDVEVASTATVVYDSVRHAFVIESATEGADSTMAYATGTLAAPIKLTSATGAVLSQGADEATPAGTLGNVVNATQNWATFLTTWEPLLADKLAFAAWVQTQNQRWAYIAWDSDEAPKVGAAPESFGAQVAAAAMNGVFVVWDADGKKGAFVAGTTASIDFTQAEGRITYAFKAQAGLLADVVDATVANNLLANGYNFYGAYATANDQFVNLQNGSVAGSWRWLDAYINQIWLNNALQLAYMTLLTQEKSIPYNAAGYSKLRAAGLDPINAALLFGAIRVGVPLSSQQRAQVNVAAGANIADTLEDVGYYLQILPASPEVRAVRGSPPMTLWYMDGGSIQKINLASINIQ